MTARSLGAVAGAVLVATGAGVVAVPAPAHASLGAFLYRDAATGLPTPLLVPPEQECIAARGSWAHNLTGSDVILYHDGACENYLLVLVPAESLNLPFASLGFVPAGGRPAPPAQ